MRAFLLSLLTLFLFGCGAVTPDSDNAAYVEEIRVQTERLCGYLPAASVVTQIVAAASGQGAIVGIIPIASAICSAVSTKRYASAMVEGCASVNNVCLKGEWKR